MPDSIFQWRLDATMHKSSVEALRREIVDAYLKQQPLPIGLIFALLPVNSHQTQDAIRRGAFAIQKDRFENMAADELLMEFDDPAMGTFNATLPAAIKGTLTHKAVESIILIDFDVGISLEIPKLAEQGVDRSSFQNLVSVRMSPGATITVLKDAQAADKITHIEAILDSTAPASLLLTERTEILAEMFNLGGQCSTGGDPNEQNWYVYRRNDGLCVVHYGTMIVGGQIAYTYIAGPMTYQQAQDYANTHCPDGIC